MEPRKPKLPAIPAVDDNLQQYYDDMATLSQAAQSGQIDERDFKQEAERLTVGVLFALYLLGGGNYSEINEALADDIARQRRSIAILSDDIYSGRYSARTEEEATKGLPEQTNERGIEMLLTRLVKWGVGVFVGYNVGRMFQAPVFDYEAGAMVEPAEIWTRGATKEGCHDCITLDGVVLTVSDWRRLRAAGVYPQSHDLECNGYECLCRLSPSDLPPDDIDSVLRALGV